MKKRLAALLLFCILSIVALPAAATGTEKSPEELYQEYEAIVEETNKRYDFTISLTAFEELDQKYMSTIQGFQADVDTLVKAALYLEKYQGGQQPELGFFQQLFRSLFGPAEAERGAGAKEVSLNTPIYDSAFGLDWAMTPLFLVNTAPGTPSYYIQEVRNADMTPAIVPEGYQLAANGSAWYEVSPNKKACTIYQQFTLSKNYVSVPVVPHVALYVDSETGVISIGEKEASQ